MQGFNMGRYVPPDQEGVMSGNQLNKKHPLGNRASKQSTDGSLTVRFEMPFAVWCGTCPQPTIIGQGVRFNAAKTRVGSYHSSPIFSFRMRHAACGGTIEIRTDPRNTAYEVVSGGRRREEASATDDSLVGDGAALARAAMVTDKERSDAREHAFANLEKTIADRAAAAAGAERVDELRDAARRWEDPYERNRLLRREFRKGRKIREGEVAETEDLKDRMSLGIDLVAAREEDATRAKLVDFGAVDNEEGDNNGPGRRVDKALARPLFDRTAGADRSHRSDTGRAESRHEICKIKGKVARKSRVAASKMRESLVSEVVVNTRAAKDPFLAFGSKETSSKPLPSRLLPGIIGKKRSAEDGPDPSAGEPPPAKAVATSGLVSYDSD